jgi:hypothetical protein
MTVTSMFAKTSKKRKIENGLHEKEGSREELTVVQNSVGKAEIETADTEVQVEKKVKLRDGDPAAETLVSVVIFYSFSKYSRYLICGRLNALWVHKLNWQALSSL